MKKRRAYWKGALSLAALLLSGVLFFVALGHFETGRTEEGRQQLESALRRAAVACYATEGFYPPSVDYLTQHYGVQVDSSRYNVFYEVFAENLMPDITVLIKEP